MAVIAVNVNCRKQNYGHPCAGQDAWITIIGIHTLLGKDLPALGQQKMDNNMLVDMYLRWFHHHIYACSNQVPSAMYLKIYIDLNSRKVICLPVNQVINLGINN